MAEHPAGGFRTVSMRVGESINLKITSGEETRTYYYFLQRATLDPT